MMGMGGGGSPMGGGGMGGMDPMGNMNPLSTGRINMPGSNGNMGMDLHRIPVVGNMFQNPYDMFKQQQMQNAAAAYSMYRPEAAQAWGNAQNQQSAALQPMNDAIASMYGSGATQGFEAQNPFGPTAFQRGAAVGTDPSMPTPGSGPKPPPGQAGAFPPGIPPGMFPPGMPPGAMPPGFPPGMPPPGMMPPGITPEMMMDAGMTGGGAMANGMGSLVQGGRQVPGYAADAYGGVGQGFRKVFTSE